jgi:hypothetical protein
MRTMMQETTMIWMMITFNGIHTTKKTQSHDWVFYWLSFFILVVQLSKYEVKDFYHFVYCFECCR